MLSSGSGRIAATMSAIILSSTRKFWPNFFFALCPLMPRQLKFGHLRRESDRLQQAAAVGLAGPRQIQRGAVIHRGAYDWQAQRDVHTLAEARMLQHRQPLI